MALRAKVAFLLLLMSFGAEGQFPVNPRLSAKMNRILDGPIHGKHLDCTIQTAGPFLDFAFQFESGYVVRCPVKLFGGEASQIIDILRITPDGGHAVLLARRAMIPAVPPELKSRVDLRKVNSKIEYSGAFATGEGGYSVELAVLDLKHRSVRKRWHIHAQRHGIQRAAIAALAPGAVAAVGATTWKHAASSPHQPRITILLDAAPVRASEQRLHAWDRAMLLDELSSVLTQLECSSIRLVAFNLDQQREIFRDDQFNEAAWPRLVDRLRDLELGAVSYHVLQRRHGWASLLSDLLNAETASSRPPDAVILLGPKTRIDGEIPPELIPARKPSMPALFDIAYYPFWLQGREFPDGPARMIEDMGGKLLKIHSPGELGQAITKIRNRLDDEPR